MTTSSTSRIPWAVWLPKICGFVVAIVFATAAVIKLCDLGAFASSVAAYRVTTPLAAKVWAALIPIMELAVASALVVPRTRRVAGFIAAGMLALLTLAIVGAKAGGLDMPCGCFGAGSATVGKDFGWLIFRNLGLLACSIGAICNLRSFLSARAAWAPQFVGITWSSAALGLGLSIFVPTPLSPAKQFVITASKIVPSKSVVGAGASKGMTDLRPEEIRRALSAALTMPAPPALSLAEARIKFPKALWIDARPAELYAKGRLAGAISATPTTIAALIKELRDEHAMFRPLIVYCAPDCHNSTIVGNTLLQVGFQSVTVIDGGWNGIASANTQ